MKKSLVNLLTPNWQKILVFVLIAFIMPVPFLLREPLTQLPGNTEWVWKYVRYESLFTDVFGGYTSELDVFIEVVVRDYVSNYLGTQLLLLYYFAACAVYESIIRFAQRSTPQ